MSIALYYFIAGFIGGGVVLTAFGMWSYKKQAIEDGYEWVRSGKIDGVIAENVGLREENTELRNLVEYEKELRAGEDCCLEMRSENEKGEITCLVHLRKELPTIPK